VVVERANLRDGEQALASVVALARTPLAERAGLLSDLVQDLVPHRILAMLAGSCARSPMSVAGEQSLADRITSGDLARVAGGVAAGLPWVGDSVIAGAKRPVLLVAGGPSEHAMILLLIRRDNQPVDARDACLVANLWGILVAQTASSIEDAEPGALTASRAAASERIRVASELTDMQAGTLASLLGTLRARDLDDRAARLAAVDLAAAALVELRAAAERETELGDEPAARAFDALRNELAPLARFGSAELEFVGGGLESDADRLLPALVAQTARAIVRRAILTMLEQGDVRRVRVAWELGDDLIVTVRDDGQGDLSADAIALRAILDRAHALGGTVEVESVPGWGTRILARLPLQAGVERTNADPLSGLAPRELDVLVELARGQRNREIAATLGISENTVKFHVTNVLSKLGVHSRGEAAAVAHEAGLSAPRLSMAS
jgi:DNA-binding CsgD family transcriptional regulator